MDNKQLLFNQKLKKSLSIYYNDLNNNLEICLNYLNSILSFIFKLNQMLKIYYYQKLSTDFIQTMKN